LELFNQPGYFSKKILLLAGRTVALMLQCCSCLPSVTYVLWLNGASYRKSVRRSKQEMAYGNRMVT